MLGQSGTDGAGIVAASNPNRRFEKLEWFQDAGAIGIEDQKARRWLEAPCLLRLYCCQQNLKVLAVSAI